MDLSNFLWVTAGVRYCQPEKVQRLRQCAADNVNVKGPAQAELGQGTQIFGIVLGNLLIAHGR